MLSPIPRLGFSNNPNDHGGAMAWYLTLCEAQKHSMPTVAALRAIDIHERR
jgi:hypothetical protein